MAGEDLSDAKLLGRSARGDQGAFTALYDRLAPMVLVRLRRRCADDDVVADVLQETFAAAWRAAGTWDGRGEVAAWVWTIAARRLVDAFRRRAARVATVPYGLVGGGDGTDAAGGAPAAALAAGRRTGSGASAEEQVVGVMLSGPLEVALAALSPELRAVLQATVLDGMSTREAAVVLEIPEGTVKTRAMRARTTLREALA